MMVTDGYRWSVGYGGQISHSFHLLDHSIWCLRSTVSTEPPTSMLRLGKKSVVGSEVATGHHHGELNPYKLGTKPLYSFFFHLQLELHFQVGIYGVIYLLFLNFYHF